MSLSISDVTDAVELEIANQTYKGSATGTGDGTTATWVIAPLGYYVLPDTVAATVAGVSSTAFLVDYDIGTITFDSPPADAAALVFWFDYAAFHPDVIELACLAAIDQMFPSFYKTDTEDVTSDGESLEYDLAAGEFVTSVFYRADSSAQYQRIQRKRYETYSHGTTKYIRFFTAPSEGTLRVHTVQRCAIADLPDRALGPLVSYACYYLITQKMAPRTRGDVAVVTQGVGTLSPRQMNDAAQAFLLRYQIQMDKVRMAPWSVH